jgi:two-component system, OmpR family, copper resistance phosphate regulon response regulator CusR
MRILLAEDDPRISKFVAKGLREQSYAVDVSADGEAALYQADINTYDLFILDVMIPRVDGFAVCRKLRESGNRSPILMLTARDAVEDRISGLDSGADDYLIKPFSFPELLARLRALLRRPKDVRAAEIAIADLVLDPSGRRVFRANSPIIVTTKEYALLEYLARNEGRIVGREEIAEHVWDDSFDPFSNLIEVYVNRLRKKIDLPGMVSLLHTKRGAGYSLGAGDKPSPASNAAPRESTTGRAKRSGKVRQQDDV